VYTVFSVSFQQYIPGNFKSVILQHIIGLMSVIKFAKSLLLIQQ